MSELPLVGVTAIIAGMAAFNRDAAIVEGRLLGINRVATDLERTSTGAFGAFGAGFAATAGAVATGATLIAGGIGLAGAASIKFAADFEQGLALTRALTGATEQQMQDLSHTIVDLSRHGAVSMSDLAKATTELGRSGVSLPDIMGGALKAVQDLTVASGGEIGLEKAAKLTATSMQAFGLSVDQVDRITTAATVVAQNSALTFTDFGQAVATAGAPFASVGFSIEDLATAEALLGRNGLSGSVGATALRNIIQRLEKPSKDAAKVMQEYGIHLFDASGKAVTFRDLLAQLNGAFSDQAVAEGKLTEKQRDQALATLFLQRAGAAALILTREGTQGYDELRKSFDNLKASDLVEIVMKPLNKQLEVGLNNVLALAYGFGIQFIPALEDAASGVVKFLQSLKFEDAEKFGQSVLAAILTVIGAATNLVTGFQSIVAQLGLTDAASQFLVSTLVGLGVVITTVLAAGIISAVASFGSFLLVIGVVATAIANLANPIADIIDGFGNWLRQFGPIGNALADLDSVASSTLRAIGDLMRGDFSGAAAEAGNALSGLSTVVNNDINPALEAMRTGVQDAAGVLAPWAEQAGAAGVVVTEAIAGTNDAIMALEFLFQGNLPAASATAQEAMDHFGTAVQNIIPAAQEAWDGVSTTVMNAVTNIVSTLQAFASQVLATVQDAFEAASAVAIAIWNQLPPSLRNDLEAIVSDVQELFGLLPQIITNILTEVATIAGQLATAIVDAIMNNLLPLIARALEMLGQFAQNVAGFLQGMIALVGPIALSIGQAIVNGLIQGIAAGVGPAVAAIRGLMDSVVAAARASVDAHSPSRIMAALGEDIDAGLSEGIDNEVPQVEDSAANAGISAASAMINAIDAMKVPVRASGARVVDELVNAFNDVQGRAGQAMVDLQDKVSAAGEKVGQKINEATIAAAEQITKTIEDANRRIADLQTNLGQSRSDTGRRDALSASQDVRRQARKQAQEDADAQAKHQKALDDAQAKHADDLAKIQAAAENKLAGESNAKKRGTIQHQRDLDIANSEFKYQQQLADIDKQFAVEEKARLETRRRQQEDADFERNLTAETKALNTQLEDEALARSIQRANDERDARITAINQALDAKIKKIQDEGAKEIENLNANVKRKLTILEDEFAKKAADVLRKGGENMRPLVDNIQDILSGNFAAMKDAADGFAGSVEHAIGALKRLEEARARAQFSSPSLPSPTAGLVSGEEVTPTDYTSVLDAPSPSGNEGALPEFAHGGVVPGPWGKPLLAIVHGGEFIAAMHTEAARWARQMSQYQPQANKYVNYNVNATYANTQSPASVEMDMRALVALSRGG